jgi:2-C-methyl-D-erythritol 2,4-cyclodiphosphate synthase
MTDSPPDSPLNLCRVGIGHDRHRLVAGTGPLVIGGIEIPFDGHLLGHSDADVLLHALTDAILGALGRGDIGEWFPDTAAENKGRDSKEMLRVVLEKTRDTPFRIINVDATLFAEAPKFSPHKQPIRDSIASLLGIAPTRVNVKAKTGEKVGPIGRREAIDSEVVVLLELLSS